MILYQLFPEPLYVSQLERTFTKAELQLTDEYKKKTHKSIGNTTTNDHCVLEHKTFKTLKQELNKMILNYFDKVVCTSNSITPYITQSWLNYTEPNQFHHRHYHHNSYVSGILYMNADKAVDKVIFHRTTHPLIDLKISTPNAFNSRVSWHVVETGDVILFPSQLEHSVESKKGTNTRISLSFNVFFKGTIGNDENLTELVL